MRFLALVHKEPYSCYGVSFPDVHGCTSAGDTLDEALTNAVDALSGHIRLMEADGEATPTPRTIEVLNSDPDFAEDLKGAINIVMH